MLLKTHLMFFPCAYPATALYPRVPALELWIQLGVELSSLSRGGNPMITVTRTVRPVKAIHVRRNFVDVLAEKTYVNFCFLYYSLKNY